MHTEEPLLLPTTTQAMCTDEPVLLPSTHTDCLHPLDPDTPMTDSGLTADEPVLLPSTHTDCLHLLHPDTPMTGSGLTSNEHAACPTAEPSIRPEVEAPSGGPAPAPAAPTAPIAPGQLCSPDLQINEQPPSDLTADPAPDPVTLAPPGSSCGPASDSVMRMGSLGPVILHGPPLIEVRTDLGSFSVLVKGIVFHTFAETSIKILPRASTSLFHPDASSFKV